MTEAALAANRANAKKSTGPRESTAVKFNAVQYGFTSKSLFFESEEERAAYEEFTSRLREDLQPQSLVEEMLFEELSISWWKVQTIDPLLFRQMRSQADASTKVYNAYLDARRQYEGDAIGAAARLQGVLNDGWECQQLGLSTGGGQEKDETAEASEIGSAQSRKGNGRITVRLGNSTESLLRYSNAWRRDFYRALGVLLALKSGE